MLPGWALELPERELRMVLLHEEEHLRAEDTRLLGAALGLLVLTAWNPVSWWQLRRLRLSVEIDCDLRVLRRTHDRAAYGASLITVAARASGPSLGLAAFTERSVSLRKRILAMTVIHSRRSLLAGVLLVVLGVVSGVQACGVSNPMASDDPEPGVARASRPTPDAPPAAADASAPATERKAPPSSAAGPTFTPFTVAPSVLNRSEVIHAMADAYTPRLRSAGISGTVKVWFFINARGTVDAVRVDRSSGHPELDRAALEVARVFRFSPALNGEQHVPVWVSFPITFPLR